MNRHNAIRLFSERQMYAHQKIIELTIKIANNPGNAAVDGSELTSEIAKHIVACDVLALLGTCDISGDPRSEIITELEANLCGKLGIIYESNFYSMALRLAQVRVIGDTLEMLRDT